MATKNSQRDSVSFVIVTYTNTSGLVSLLKNIEQFYADSKVVIVNNNSAITLEEKIPVAEFNLRIMVVNNHKNLGFGKAANDGARQAQALFNPRYLVFVNDDVGFDKDWVTPCIKELEKNTWVATAPVQKGPSGDNYGYIVLSYGKVEIVKKRSDIRSLDGLTAAAFIFRKDDFFLLRGFDPAYFAYLEDVDLFLRAKKRGMKFGVTKSISVFHEGQKTSSQFRVKKAYLDFRNWIILIVKNWGMKKILLNFPAICVERLRNFWGIVKTILNFKF